MEAKAEAVTKGYVIKRQILKPDKPAATSDFSK